MAVSLIGGRSRLVTGRLNFSVKAELQVSLKLMQFKGEGKKESLKGQIPHPFTPSFVGPVEKVSQGELRWLSRTMILFRREGLYKDLLLLWIAGMYCCVRLYTHIK